MERNGEVYVTDDVWLASFLLARGAHLGEPIVEGGNVVFRVEGPGVADDADLFLRGQAMANVHALKSGMNLAKDFIAATKRRNGGGPGRAVRPVGRASESGTARDGGMGRESGEGRESARGSYGPSGRGQAQG